MRVQGSCSEFLGVILGVAFLGVGDFYTPEHLFACGDVYGSEGILHSLIVCMRVGGNFV